MKRITCLHSLTLAVSLFATTVWSRDMDDQYAVFGVGAENCAAYLVARDHGGAAERWYHHWLAGFMTAVNNAAAGTYNILGDKSMADTLDWLEGYCAANPNVNFTSAVADLVSILYDERQNIAPGKQGGWNKFKSQTTPEP
jgi:hypothetical protein